MLSNLYVILCCVVFSCQALQCNNKREKRDELEEEVQLWPHNTIPYEITQEYTLDERKLIESSLAEVTEKTDNCLKFVPKSEQHAAWVRIISEQGCWSRIGMAVQEGPQDLSLDRAGCVTRNTVMHEFLHAYGMVHEQTREDRDKYVEILYENIEPDNIFNFNKDPRGLAQSFGLPYDYYSVMQYEDWSFSVNCLRTVLPRGKDKKHLRFRIGPGNTLTSIDIAKIKKIGGCK